MAVQIERLIAVQYGLNLDGDATRLNQTLPDDGKRWEVERVRAFALVHAGYCDCAGAAGAGVSRGAGECGLCRVLAGGSAAPGVAAVFTARFSEQEDGSGNAGLGA